MFTFPGREWVEEFAKGLNNSPEFAKAAGKWEGSICFAVEAEPGKLDKSVYIYMNPTHGKVEEAALLDSPDEKKVDYLLVGPYSLWKEIVQGKTDSMQAIMKGKLKLKGNMAALLKQVKASQVMMAQLKTIPTRFIDEA